MWRSAVQVCLGLHIAAGNVLQVVILKLIKYGGLAQLARALAWHARGHRFDPDILHVCSLEHEIFDILTHKTVSKDFKLKTELYISITSQFTAESMSYANA